MVELSKTLGCESAGEVTGCQLWLDVESSDRRSQLPGVCQRLVPDRDQAGHGELAQEAEPWQADGDPRRGHDDPSFTFRSSIGIVTRRLRCREPGNTCRRPSSVVPNRRRHAMRRGIVFLVPATLILLLAAGPASPEVSFSWAPPPSSSSWPLARHGPAAGW